MASNSYTDTQEKRVLIVASNLRKLSTEYVVSEDRIRIIGESQGSEPVVIWMTNRLASRAVPAIWRWLEKEASAASTPLEGTVVQSFAQEAAVADLKPQKPVTAKTGAPTWVAQAVDVSATKSHIRLTFRGQQDQSASVRFGAKELRQWLSILHRAWSKAEWPQLAWPDWIKREKSTPHHIVLH